MKSKVVVFIVCFFCQFCLGQTLTRKNLHGMVVNDSITIQSGSVFNVSSKSRSIINSQGFFDILAKTNDTLVFSSFGLKPKKIVLASNDFKASVFIVKLNMLVNQLNEVVVTKTFVKPNLGNTQTIVDTQYMDDKQSSVDSPLDLKYAMDLGRVGKMIWKALVKTPDNSKMIEYGDFSDVVHERVTPSFFTNTLQLKQDEIGLFIIFCENDPKAKTLLKPEAEFELIEFLILKNEEFKKNAALGK